ncbi:hypothetical protein AA313_de0201571 [Arthrobotrys entomopaga]|nr:hypothetical protein AA313_de0201571 [Arthrobotrys entomopaga]
MKTIIIAAISILCFRSTFILAAPPPPPVSSTTTTTTTATISPATINETISFIENLAQFILPHDIPPSVRQNIANEFTSIKANFKNLNLTPKQLPIIQLIRPEDLDFKLGGGSGGGSVLDPKIIKDIIGTPSRISDILNGGKFDKFSSSPGKIHKRAASVQDFLSRITPLVDTLCTIVGCETDLHLTLRDNLKDDNNNSYKEVWVLDRIVGWANGTYPMAVVNYYPDLNEEVAGEVVGSAAAIVDAYSGIVENAPSSSSTTTTTALVLRDVSGTGDGVWKKRGDIMAGIEGSFDSEYAPYIAAAIFVLVILLI